MTVYAYFFQGGGWNQNSQLDLVRSLVEQHSCDISHYASNTEDISLQGENIYSNKAPGLAFGLVIPYLALQEIEKAIGIQVTSERAISVNAYILTLLGSAMPATLLALLVMAWLRRESVPLGARIILTASFAFGTLVLPYAGALMNHNLVALSLFAAWYCVSRAKCSGSDCLYAGLWSGVALITDYATLPAIVLIGILVLLKRRGLFPMLQFLAGPLVGVLGLLAYQWACFGQIGASSYSLTTKEFLDEELFLGLFRFPQFNVLYYLTVHPMKGLFFCCPLFALALAYPVWKKNRLDFLRRPELWIAVLVILYFLLLNMSMKTWTAGWGVGPRYLIPMLPFLFVFTRAVWDWSKVVYLLVAAPSILFMLSVTLVGTFMPVPNYWPAPVPMPHPLRWVLRWLFDDRVSVNTQSIFEKLPTGWDAVTPADQWDSYNLGELFGFHGIMSLLPLLLIVLVLSALLWRRIYAR